MLLLLTQVIPLVLGSNTEGDIVEITQREIMSTDIPQLDYASIPQNHGLFSQPTCDPAPMWARRGRYGVGWRQARSRPQTHLFMNKYFSIYSLPMVVFKIVDTVVLTILHKFGGSEKDSLTSPHHHNQRYVYFSILVFYFSLAGNNPNLWAFQ